MLDGDDDHRAAREDRHHLPGAAAAALAHASPTMSASASTHCPTRGARARAWRARSSASALPTRRGCGRANCPAGRRSGSRIARALVPRPEVLLLDEPFSALDAFTRADLQDHLLDLWADTRPTLVLVTHDVEEAIVLADRIMVMRPRPGRLSRGDRDRSAAPARPPVGGVRFRQAPRAGRARPLARPRGDHRRRRDQGGGRRRAVVVTDGGFGHKRLAFFRGCRLSVQQSEPRRSPMDAAALRAMQAPIKERYKGDPKAAFITLKAKGTLDDTHIACKVETGRALAVAGLHPATGGSGLELCSGDMLLEALVACAGVTLKAVATALDIPLKSGKVVGRRRSRFPRHARRRQGRAGRLRADPPALRGRHRRAAGQARSAAQAHRALLRRLPDDQERPAGRGEAQPRLICVQPAPRRVVMPRA